MRRTAPALLALALAVVPQVASAQLMTTETRDPGQKQDAAFEKDYKAWLKNPKHGSPLVDHLPVVAGIPQPKDIIGYNVGAPKKLTYYADQLKYYRALAAATPRVKVETIGKSDEGRELVVVWVSSEANMKKLPQNRANLGKIADPRGESEAQIKQLITQTKPHYHLMGGLHSGETGPSEMLMELVYRLATETSPVITQIRNNVYVSVTPVADADGRDRNVDWFFKGLDEAAASPPAPATPVVAAATADTSAAGRGGRGGRGAGGAGAAGAVAGTPGAPGAGGPPGEGGGGGGQFGGRGGGAVPYWGKYVYHDNNRDINVALLQMRTIVDWYFTAHPPIMHDLHEAQPLLYTYSGAAPQNPNLDPLLFSELPWFANFEMAQMTKYGMPGVYTNAFMDGWSPGYLGSVAYNHNGLMKMYETQSGRDIDTLPTKTATAMAAIPAGRGGAVPTGRGGAQDREWYRGIQYTPYDLNTFTRRSNTNYMETGVISALQLTAMFPATILENFYIKTRNSIEEGKSKAPYGYVIPVQRDMTKVAEFVNVLRIQQIEVGVASEPVKIGDKTYPVGSYVVKRDQPYGRLAKNLIEKQQYPDARLQTYDDSGWSMGYAFNIDVVESADSSILKVKTTPVTTAKLNGKLAGTGTAGIAVAHLGSNNMISFRYKLRNVPMRVAEKSFTADGVEFPAGSFIISDNAAAAQVKAAVEEFGLTASALNTVPTVTSHDADVPRLAIYSQWTGTQNLGWYRFTFDKFGVPYDLIYKEQVVKGGLRAKYDVILVAEQPLGRNVVMAAPAAKPQTYLKNDKYKFLGMYGETSDMSGGFGQAGVDAFADFLEKGGTLIAVGESARLPIEFGWAGTVDKTTVAGLTSQRPLVEGEIVKPEHPVFYGFANKKIPVKYVGGTPFKVGIADESNILARYVGGDAAVISGLMTGADSLKGRPFAVDIPQAYKGQGRVIMFSNNPIYRWQNHGEFNMVFNSVLNWNDEPKPAAKVEPKIVP